jgi:hypothetical protein
MGCTTEEPEFDLWQRQEIFSLHNVQTGAGSHPMGAVGCFLVGKAAGE